MQLRNNNLAIGSWRRAPSLESFSFQCKMQDQNRRLLLSAAILPILGLSNFGAVPVAHWKENCISLPSPKIT